MMILLSSLVLINCCQFPVEFFGIKILIDVLKHKVEVQCNDPVECQVGYG